jgi:predicted transcriptional regulator
VQEWQIEGIRKAIRSLDDGRSIPHEDVAAWVESWGTEHELPKPKA